MRESHTAVLERETELTGAYETEPYEAAWATEAIFFVRVEGEPVEQRARVQVSPDGMHWCDEGTALRFEGGGRLAHAKVTHFGGWLRLVGEVAGGAPLRLTVHLVLKG